MSDRFLLTGVVVSTGCVKHAENTDWCYRFERIFFSKPSRFNLFYVDLAFSCSNGAAKPESGIMSATGNKTNTKIHVNYQHTNTFTQSPSLARLLHIVVSDFRDRI